MNTPDKADEMPDFTDDLKFDPTEMGSAPCAYYALLWDYTSPADILVRLEQRGVDTHEKAEAKAKEVVKRWNEYASLRKAVREMADMLVDARASTNETLAFYRPEGWHEDDLSDLKKLEAEIKAVLETHSSTIQGCK